MDYREARFSICYPNPWAYGGLGPESMTISMSYCPEQNHYHLWINLSKDNTERSYQDGWSGSWADYSPADVWKKAEGVLRSLLEYELWIDPDKYLEEEPWLLDFCEDDFTVDRWRHYYDVGTHAVILDHAPAV